MGNWEKQMEVAKERREKSKQIKAKYSLDLSKFVFAAIVLGGFTPMFTDVGIPTNWIIILGGVVSTSFLGILGYRILKQK